MPKITRDLSRQTIIVFLWICCWLSVVWTVVFAVEIPRVHTNISMENDTLIFIDSAGNRLPLYEKKGPYTLDQLRINPEGSDSGITFQFGNTELNGRLLFGLLEPPERIRLSYPVFGASAKIINGLARVNILNELSGIYDFTGWEQTGEVRLGYRIINDKGVMLYDGKLILSGAGPFEVDISIIEGPFLNLVTDHSVVVSFQTNQAIVARVIVENKSFADRESSFNHEIAVDGLRPDTEYEYAVAYGKHRDTYTFRTAPAPGSRLPFTFAFASDSRANYGGGERDLWGTNAYIVKRLGVASMQYDARFIQFTGDMVDGYTSGEGEIMLEYANFKRAIEPFAHYFPLIAGIGNHEILMYQFNKTRPRARIDRFPFDSVSSEVAFARNFVNPTHGPVSEDGAVYDPDPETINFPPYGETIFYYTYDNIAMVVLNSNYWFAPSSYRDQTGGNPHAYVMDNQLAWLKTTLEQLENETTIDHVFVTIHTPLFPNGGHLHDDMWWNGNNAIRPVVAGKPVKFGIIERRDHLLDLMMNHSTKVQTILVGDEHNYNVLRIDETMSMYPPAYPHQKLTKIRPLWQITNGAAGAPYYGQEAAPWSANVRAFTTQNALVLFHVDGQSVTCEVLNPDTMEKLDEFIVCPMQ